MRPMMGEYMLYYADRLAVYLCDNRMLVKDLPLARALLPDAPREAPYPGAKDMLLVEAVDDRAFIVKLLETIYPELPVPKPKQGKKNAQSS